MRKPLGYIAVLPQTKKLNLKKTKKYRLATLFERIGEVAVSWAFLEDTLDDVIDLLHFQLGGDKLESEIPRTAFSRKLDYLRRCKVCLFKNLSIVGVNIDDLLKFLEQAGELRHQIIHGVVANISEYPNRGVASTYRFLRKKDSAQIVSVPFDLRSIREFSRHVLSLWIALGAVEEELRSGPMPNDDAYKSFRGRLVQLGGIRPFPTKHRSLWT